MKRICMAMIVLCTMAVAQTSSSSSGDTSATQSSTNPTSMGTSARQNGTSNTQYDHANNNGANGQPGNMTSGQGDAHGTPAASDPNNPNGASSTGSTGTQSNGSSNGNGGTSPQASLHPEGTMLLAQAGGGGGQQTNGLGAPGQTVNGSGNTTTAYLKVTKKVRTLTGCVVRKNGAYYLDEKGKNKEILLDAGSNQISQHEGHTVRVTGHVETDVDKEGAAGTRATATGGENTELDTDRDNLKALQVGNVQMLSSTCNNNGSGSSGSMQ